MTDTVRIQSIVVRAHPKRRLAIGIAILLLSLFALYFVYELGRYDAGYDRMAVAQQRVEQKVIIERLEKMNRELRTQLAELDTVRIGRAREQAEVARTIGDLQAQIARQSQELAFYQGIVTQSGTRGPGVRVQQLRISSTDKAGQFRVHFALVRSGRPDDVVTGALTLAVDGESAGIPTTLNLAALTDGKQRELPVTFRYFENFEQEIALPSGFLPEQLTVVMRSGRKGREPLTQTFLWSVD